MRLNLVEKLRSVYLFIFDSFAVDTLDIQNEFEMSNGKVLQLCHILEDLRLIVGQLCNVDSNGDLGNMRGHGKGERPGSRYLWQCEETYDHISEEEAKILFDKKLTTMVHLGGSLILEELKNV